MTLQDYAARLGLPVTIDIEPSRKFIHYQMRPEYVTIHNAGTASNGKAVHTYNRRCIRTTEDGVKDWHWSVGEDGAFQGLPMDVNAWHAGDGNGDGNRKSIAIEIARDLSDDAAVYAQAETNGAKLAAILLKIYGLDVDDLRTHHDWSGKWCPHRILSEGRWPQFKQTVAGYMAKLDNPITVTHVPSGPPPTPGTQTTTKPANRVIYRLQIGAFGNLDNAIRYRDRCTQALRDAGIISDNPREAPYIVTAKVD